MKLVFLILSALLAVQYAKCSPNENDKACAFNSTSLHSTSAEALDVKARNQIAAVDIEHIYTDSYGTEKTKKELRVTLSKGEEKWVYLWASFNTHDRSLYIRFDGERVTASMASLSVYYNSITVETSGKWSCLNWSLKKGQYGRGTFSTYTSYRESSGLQFYRDTIDIRVLAPNIPLGPSKDLECFHTQFPSVKASSNNRLRVNLTKMYYKKVGVSKWCCRDVKEESTVIDLTEGQTKTISLKYVSITNSIGASEEEKRRFKDENPRNLTMIFSSGVLYVGMAKLEETAYHTGKRWLYSSSWKCVNVTMEMNTGSTGTRTTRLDFFSYYSNAGPVTTIQRRTDYVLLEVQQSRACIMSSPVAVFIVALIVYLGNLLNIC